MEEYRGQNVNKDKKDVSFEDINYQLEVIGLDFNSIKDERDKYHDECVALEKDLIVANDEVTNLINVFYFWRSFRLLFFYVFHCLIL